MHASTTALSQFDIAYEIVQHVDIDASSTDLEVIRYLDYWQARCWRPLVYKYAQTLARLARTCRALSELALDKLWSAPPGGICRLFRLFSAFKIKIVQSTTRIGGRSVKTGTYHLYFLQGKIKPAEWKSFLKHASRVREIGYYPSEFWADCKVDDRVFNTIWELSGGRPLFPNLQSLLYGAEPNQLFRMLLCPSLMSVTLWHPLLPSRRAYYGDAAHVEIITASCPGLECINVEYDFPNLQALAPLNKCRHLRSVSFTLGTTVDLHSLLSLGELQRLQSLVARMPEKKDNVSAASSTTGHSQHSHISPGAASFSAIEKLNLSGTIEDITTFIGFCTSHTLASVILWASLPPGAGEIWVLRCITTLCSPRHISTLRHVELHFTSHSPRTHPFMVQGLDSHVRQSIMELVGPLLQLHQLESLKFAASYRTLTIADEDIAQMAAAWPKVVTIYIATAVLTHDRRHPGQEEQALADYPSLTALVSLVQRCRLLAELSIDVKDVSEDEIRLLEEDLVSGVLEPHSNMVTFVLGRGPTPASLAIHDVARLASVLHAMFPCIQGDAPVGTIHVGEIPDAHKLRLRLDELQKERRCARNLS